MHDHEKITKDSEECICGGPLEFDSDDQGRTIAKCRGECGLLYFVGDS